ncbi:glutathione S-transferase family protein [soil metagenome]
MYTLFIANKNYSSWSLRPWVLMRELAIPFTEKLMPFEPSSNWQAFRDFSPTGKVPCLHEGELMAWDSLGISEFLADRHSTVWPKQEQARLWARCAAAEMHSGFGSLRDICSMNIGLRIRLAAITPALQQDIDRLNELWSEGLSRFGGPFLAGSAFSAVDAFYAPVVFRIQTFGLPMNQAASAYVQHMLALPSMQQWQTDALAESWREPGHEHAALAAGELIADLRA